VSGYFKHEKFKEPETDIFSSPAPNVEQFDYLQKTDDTEAGARFSRTFGRTTDIELVALRTSRRRTTDSASFVADPSSLGADGASDFLNARRSSELILRAVVKRRIGTRLSLEAGVESADNRLDSRTAFTVDGVALALPAANVRVQETRTETFLKAAWRPSPSLTIDAALRYESSEIASSGDVVLAKSLQFAKPRLSIAWSPRPTTQVRLRVEREVGQLDFDNFVAASNLTTSVGVTAGNPDLNPETDWVYWVEVEQQLWRGSSLLLSARHFDITDVVDRGPVFSRDVVFDQPTNIGEGARDAVEATVTLRFDRFGWTGALLKADVVKRWTEVVDPTTHQTREISNIHPIDWSVNFSQDLPAAHATVGFDLYGGWRQTAYRFNFVETVKLQSFLRPYAEWKPRPDLSLRLELPLINHPRVRERDHIEMFPGPRSAGGRPDIQDRTFTFPYSWYVRVRKEFG
jgi:outer membrane receptor protein involved in Fe transport